MLALLLSILEFLWWYFLISRIWDQTKCV